jgi:hypothetical protein
MQGRADNEQARIYAELTPAERELARDWDACAWGSLDVSREDVLARASTLAPESWARFERLVMARLETSPRARQRMCELIAEALQRLIDELEP